METRKEFGLRNAPKIASDERLKLEAELAQLEKDHAQIRAFQEAGQGDGVRDSQRLTEIEARKAEIEAKLK